MGPLEIGLQVVVTLVVAFIAYTSGHRTGYTRGAKMAIQKIKEAFYNPDEE